MVDVTNFPKIILIYEENEKKNKITLSREQIVTTLLEEATLDNFLISTSTSQEFIAPIGINQFIKEKYHRSFAVNKEGHYEIDLGYHRKEKKALEKYGVKELSSYRLTVAGEQSRYYIYDNENYQRSLVALKEIKGGACFDERWHQLIYYINHQLWEKLNKELTFLLHLKTEAGVEIDYTRVLIRLYQHAKDNLNEKSQENTFEIIEEVCRHLVSEIQLQRDIQKEIYTILFELTLMRRNQLEDRDEVECAGVKKDLFIFSQKAGLEESNCYLAEMAGLGFGNTFSENVNDNPLAVLIALAKKNKATCEENVRLKAEIAKLSATNSLQENSTQLNTNTAFYFTLRK